MQHVFSIIHQTFTHTHTLHRPAYTLTQHTQTSTPQGDEPLFLGDPDFSEGESGSSSPEPDSQNEEVIFSLLFGECDTEGTGEVTVDKLVDFIKTVQVGEHRTEGDEVYDSQVDVSTMSTLIIVLS